MARGGNRRRHGPLRLPAVRLQRRAVDPDDEGMHMPSRHDGIQEGAQFAVRYTSCGGLGFLSSGSTILGGSVDLMLATNTGLVGWVVGLPYNLALPICPGCIQGAEGSAVLGQSYSFAVPRNASFTGMSLSFQGFQFLPAPGNGACLAQINLSNTLDATIR